jgi:hypothetical protein
MTIYEFQRQFEEQIIHSDFDGIISGLYLYNRVKMNVAGIINYKDNILSVSATPLANTFLNSQFIFNDVGTTRITSIDHHLQHYQKSNTYNANRYFNIEKPRNKMPFGNIIWLLFAFRDSLEKYNLQQIKLLLLSDGFFKIAKNPDYHKNINDWCSRLNMPDVIKLLESFDDDEMEELAKYWLSPEIKYIDNNYFWCGGSEEPELAQNKINELANIFGWQPFRFQKVVYRYILKTNNYNPSVNQVPDDSFSHYIHSNNFGKYSHISHMVEV